MRRAFLFTFLILNNFYCASCLLLIFQEKCDNKLSMNPNDKVTYFAETDARNKRVKFGIKAEDRTRHMYVIGKTGMGKSTLLENMAVQDIENGEGLCFIDPHGKTAELLLNYVPEHRLKDVLYFAPFDVDFPISFNVMEDVGYDKRHLVVSGLMSTFKKIWVDAWSARMEYILSNTLLALLEYPEATLLGVNKMLSDKVYRKKVVDNVTDPAVKSFWIDEFGKYTDKFAAEATPAIQNKIGQFTNNPLIRNIIGQPKSTFDLRQMMDDKKIIIVNLSKGRVGESNANLLGAMFITKVYLAAMSRADRDEGQMKNLPNFYLYVDEFQSFANESFADILSEARKYKLNLTIAHQYIEQMSEEVRAAVFGNVGTMIVFRVGSFDAEQFEKEFAPQFTAEDIVNLGKYQIYLRLMIDGVGSQPFSGQSMPPIPVPPISYRQQSMEYSRANFAQARVKVEEDIRIQVLGDGLVESGGERKDERKEYRKDDKREERRDERRDEKKHFQNNHSNQDNNQQRNQDGNQNRSQSQERSQEKHHHPSPILSNTPITPKVPIAVPPPDDSGGFQSLKDLKTESAGRPERKGITEESKNELRDALKNIINQKSHNNQEQRSGPNQEHKSEQKKESTKEVPEDVLKKLLDIGN